MATSGIPPTGPSRGGANSVSYGLSDRDASTKDNQAAKRIEAANRAAREAEHESDAQVEHAHQQGQAALEHELASDQSAIENERSKSAGELRELQRAQTSELARVRREGERELTQLKSYYQDATYTAQKTGKSDLDALARNQAIAQAHEQSAAQAGQGDLKQSQRMRYEAQKASDDRKFSELNQGAAKRYEQAQANDAASALKLETDFKSRHQGISDAQNETINRLNTRANEEIRSIREGTSQKLAAYQSRQTDPFYKLHDLGAELSEKDDAFILTAKIPEHERERLSVSVQGDRLMLSGFRRNEEKLDLSEGRSRGTASFQSFTETFPLRVPVDAKLLTRAFEGDQLVVTIPKHALDSNYKSAKSTRPAPPERDRVEGPHFPTNLPEARIGSDLGSKPGKGGETLS